MVQPFPEAFPETLPAGLQEAAIAATRFGYGASPGLLARIAPDPRGWLLGQLESPPDGALLAGLPSGRDRTAAFLNARAVGGDALRDFRTNLQESVEREETAHIAQALSTKAPFLERLIRFWADHFSLSARTLVGAGGAHAFEREVVRPSLGGSFAGLLAEAMRHPAMLLYLDNVGSVGPYSDAGRSGAAGMNDLMARQILSNLTQGAQVELNPGDVDALTRMLTGWSVSGPSEEGAGGFQFRSNWHEPNTKLFMNRTFPAAGALEAEAAMDMVARLPRTAENLALKMARAFVSDRPSEALVSDMVDGFVDGGNSLLGMARGMVLSPTALSPIQNKAKTPEELVFSTFRALEMGADEAPLARRALRALGQAPKATPLAGGWPDVMAAWLSPSQLAERIEWGSLMARSARPSKSRRSIPAFAFQILGPLLSPSTNRRLQVTSRPEEALALLFAAPEFQKR